jgi:hypothetical protein
LGVGSAAPVITGPALDGFNVRLASEATSLLFLTSDCKECRVAWEQVAKSDADSDIVVVTPGPETESRRRVEQLSGPSLPGSARLIMSSEVWHAFGVSKAPWLVEVRDGIVTASGPLK